jgi:hypothetical protein
MNMRIVPLATGLMPIIAIHACYLIAVQYAGLPACIPYLEGCVSISATGRYAPASYLFKAVMLPTTIMLCAYWVLNVAWLRSLEKAAGLPSRPHRSIAILGVAGALSLVLYVTFLGSAEPFYEFMRRFGVYLYFLFSVIAQLLLAQRSLAHSNLYGNATLRRISQVQLLLSVAPFLLGIVNVILKSQLPDPDTIENIIEWIFALMMQVFFLLSYYSWRVSGFKANFSAGDIADSARPLVDTRPLIDKGRKSS